MDNTNTFTITDGDNTATISNGLSVYSGTTWTNWPTVSGSYFVQCSCQRQRSLKEIMEELKERLLQEASERQIAKELIAELQRFSDGRRDDE